MLRVDYRTLNIDDRDVKLDWSVVVSKMKLHEPKVIDALNHYRKQILKGATTNDEIEDLSILGYTRILKELREKAGQLFLTVTKFNPGEDTLFSYRLGVINGNNWIVYNPPAIYVKTVNEKHVSRIIDPINASILAWKTAFERDIPIPFENFSSIYRELESPLSKEGVEPTLRIIPGNKRVCLFFKKLRNNAFPFKYFIGDNPKDYDLSFIDALRMLNSPVPEEFLAEQQRRKSLEESL